MAAKGRKTAGLTVVQRSSSRVIGGNGRLGEMKGLGWTECDVVELDIDDVGAARLAVALNRTAELAEWDGERLAEFLAADENPEELGFDVAKVQKALGGRGGGRDPGEQEPTGEPVTRRGDVWELGEHRLMCGDSTSSEEVTKLLRGGVIDAVVTDPPYCSGGFQEAGRAQGSIGTKRKGDDGREYTPTIANDKLSSRGYCALIKSVLLAWKPSFAYVFTDWRMWVQLFDVMESSGFGVRNMIVWDKGTPGMGMGWRTQHELVMFAAMASPKFDPHKAQGNVIASKRTGNPDHPTQKPVDLITAILDVTDFCKTIADPFAGSGTTLVACEETGRVCYGMELSPVFCDTAIRRWQIASGKRATRDGIAFDELAASVAEGRPNEQLESAAP